MSIFMLQAHSIIEAQAEISNKLVDYSNVNNYVEKRLQYYV